MKRNHFFTDEQVEAEIERLTVTPEVRIARQEERLRYRRRQYMYKLRALEKRGRQLVAQGVTPENMERVLFGDPEEVE